MTQKGPQQLLLFQRRRKDVSWLMKRWNKSRQTIIVMLERGIIAGFRIHPTAKWEIDEEDVLEYERKLQQEVQSVLDARQPTVTNGRNGHK